MLILGIDPGTTKSAWVIWDDTTEKALNMGITENGCLWTQFYEREFDRTVNAVAMEMIASYGMPVGKEVFETCVWIGGLLSALGYIHEMKDCFVYRKDVKLNLCGTAKAKDANIRQALIDRFGEPGTKKNPGKLYGVKADIWSAVAVAVTFSDLKKQLSK